MNLRAFSPVLLIVAACASNDDDLLLGGTPGTGGPNGADPAGSNPVLECRTDKVGREYKTFDGTSLIQSRATKALGVDRARVKPLPILYGDIERVLGKMPQPVATAFLAAAPSFDLPPVRWFEETKATGIGISTYFELTFSAALAHIEANPASYAALPTAESAKKVCDEMAHVAWRRRPSAAEVTQCTELATTKLAKETAPKKRWAYVIASVLSTADFLSY
jgi:hypothetical protein